MRRVHLVAGIATALAFLGSGAYMRSALDPESLSPSVELLYLSRHIYMLGPALLHFVLATHVR